MALPDRPPSPTRRRVIEAAARVVRERGLAGATTRAIAQAAEVSEGTIYNHFRDKIDVLLAVLTESGPSFASVATALRPGEGTVADSLASVARAALDFYASIASTTAVSGDAELMARFRASLRERGVGPHRMLEPIARYLIVEQQLGRANRDADPYIMARLLLGACYQHIFFDRLVGADLLQTPAETLAEDLARNLIAGLTP